MSPIRDEQTISETSQAGRGSASLDSVSPPAPRAAPKRDAAAGRLSAAPLTESEVTEVVSGIGPRLHALRSRHGLSLQQLADRSDVSPAAIHKVEQGTMVPTITTLLKLAASFQVPVAHFVNETGAAATPVVYTPARQRRTSTTADGTVEIGGISAESGPFDLDAAVREIAGGAQSDQAAGAAGETLVHVLSGTLELTVGGQAYRMTAGDSLHFRSEEPHAWRNPTARVTKTVWATLPERR